MKFKALVASAEGYNSGTVGVAVHFLPPDLDKELVDYILNNFQYSFSELDGKHSEVDADNYIEEDKEALCSYAAETVDYLNEILFDTIADSEWFEQAEAICDYDAEVRDKLQFNSFTKIEFIHDGEIVEPK